MAKKKATKPRKKKPILAKRVAFALTEREQRSLARAARVAGETVSEYVRRIVTSTRTTHV